MGTQCPQTQGFRGVPWGGLNPELLQRLSRCTNLVHIRAPVLRANSLIHKGVACPPLGPWLALSRGELKESL